MSVIVTGGSGFLGRTLIDQCPATQECIGINHPEDEQEQENIRYYALDITSQSLESIAQAHKPSAIIHTAAQSSVDWCEENPEQARAVNTTASIEIAKLSEKHQAHFVFISSNAVYSGQQSFNSETDQPAPVNVYGQTKYEAEQWLSKNLSSESHTIIRPNLMYGWPFSQGRDNQFSRTVKALRSREPVNGVTDTWFSPISVSTCAKIIWNLLEQKQSGIFNLGGANRTSLYDMSLEIARVFELDPSHIKSVSVKDSPALAPRAIDTSFDVSKIKRTSSVPIPSLVEELNWLKEHEASHS